MKKTAICVFLTLTVLIPCLLYNTKASYEVYKMKDFAKNALPGTQTVFYEDDFKSNVIGEGKLTGIMLLSLPSPDAGILKLERNAAALGSTITTDMLSSLVFVPASSAEFSAVFTFVPLFEGVSTELCGQSVDLTLNYYSDINNPPSAADLTFKTQTNLKIEIPFSAYDPEDDALTYTITSLKGGGSLLLKDGILIYEPATGKSGKSVIFYYAKDSYGNTSGIGSVTVSVEKPRTSLEYADLNDSVHSFAAIRMAEAGIFVGERYGKTMLLQPDKPVTVGEFVTLAMTALRIEPSSKAVLVSEEISSWQGDYMAAALELGAIDDFSAGVTITGSQAASICVKLLGVSQDGLPADRCASALGLLTDSSLLESELTRETALEILYRLTEVSSGASLGWKTAAK